MKVLLDENLSPKLRLQLQGHDVTTTVYAGWGGLRNGELLTVAGQADFQVFVTADRNLSYQQNLKDRKIAIVVLTAHSWKIIRNYLPPITNAIDSAPPGSFQLVQCGEFRRTEPK